MDPLEGSPGSAPGFQRCRKILQVIWCHHSANSPSSNHISFTEVTTVVDPSEPARSPLCRPQRRDFFYPINMIVRKFISILCCSLLVTWHPPDCVADIVVDYVFCILLYIMKSARQAEPALQASVCCQWTKSQFIEKSQSDLQSAELAGLPPHPLLWLDKEPKRLNLHQRADGRGRSYTEGSSAIYNVNIIIFGVIVQLFCDGILSMPNENNRFLLIFNQ